ncbi:MAG: serine/threonine-protein kinase [Dokdonella sp.]
MHESPNYKLDKSRRARDAMAFFDRWIATDDPAQRTRMLDELALADGSLHERVCSLIEAEQALDAAGFMAGPALMEIEASPAGATALDLAGERIGAWRVLRLLGQGGMGEVWLADRNDGAYRGHAAIKLLRGAAADSAAQRRFLREGQILARLEHPRIARLIDAGARADGRRYLILDYVDGQRIDAWADQHRLNVDARLRLFLQVCDAVAYAHANLIVHRDLKPSNVLVQDDGQARLLDFGVAKLLEDEQGVGETTALTLADGVALTPEYAAPEQIENGPVTVATDVYALGVLLYLLLAGHRPYGENASTPAQWARVIVEHEPRRLSLATGDRSEDAITRAHSRASTPDELRRSLRGDLETIVARALKKKPTERYASVAAFAEDVQRYLDHRPILARPDTFAYRTRKFVRRHRIGVAVSILAACAIVAGTIGIAWQAQIARHEAMRSGRSRDFLVNLIRDANPFSASRGNQGQTGDLLKAALDRVERDFSDAPDIQADLRNVIAHALRQVGENAKSESILKGNVDALRHLYGDASPKVGSALVELGYVRRETGDIAGARKAFVEADALLRNAGPEFRADRIELLVALARLDNQEGDHVHALELHRLVLRDREAAQGPNGPDIATDLMNIATDDGALERYAEAETLAKRADDLLVQALGPDHARRIYVQNTLGLAQVFAGHTADGVATLSDSLKRARATLPADAPMLGIVLTSVGTARYEAGDTAGAVQALTEAHAIMVKAKHPMRGQVTLMLGRAQLGERQPDALATLHDSLAELAGPAGADGRISLAQAAYGVALARSGNLGEGETAALKARTDLMAGAGAGSVTLAEIDRLLADIEEMRGDALQAHRFRAEALDVYQRVYGIEHPRTREMVAVLAATPEGGPER